MAAVTKVVIIGGGPGGYEAALVGNQLGGEVTLIERDGMGGAAVLTDCVPSKTLIATAEVMNRIKNAPNLGLHLAGDGVENVVRVDLREVNDRVLNLAQAQSNDIQHRSGTGRRGSSREARPAREPDPGGRDHREREETLDADIILLATGTTPRELPDAQPDGERILTWKQLYDLDELPERLIVGPGCDWRRVRVGLRRARLQRGAGVVAQAGPAGRGPRRRRCLAARL